MPATKSLDDAMMETLGKVTGDLAEEAPAQEEQPEAQTEAQSEQEQTAQGEQPEATEEPAAQEETQASEQPAQQPMEARQPTAPTKDGRAITGKPPKAGTPIGWPPELHGEFYKLPRPVKNQILKQQGEMARERANYQRKTKEHEEVAKRFNSVQSAMEPFLPNLKALGVAPEAAISELFQAHHVLRHGSKAERAHLVAGLVQNFDVDVATLASVLKGEAPAEGQAQPPPQQRKPEEFRDPRMDAFLANAKRLKAERERREREEQEASKARHLQELQEFAASGEAPYFDEVLEDMEIVSAAAARKGEDLTVQQVYERACYLNPKVRNLLANEEKQRREQQAQRSQQVRTRQALTAASSVKTEPGAPAGARKASLDEAILSLASRYGG